MLEHAGKTFTQSALILEYLAEQTGQFGPRDDDEKREIWRWMLYDNHKFTSYYAALRFLFCLKNTGETDVTRFLRERATAAYRIVDSHLAKTPFMVGGRLTIADLSLAGYVFMPEDTGIALADFTHIEAWKARIQALPGWKHPCAADAAHGILTHSRARPLPRVSVVLQPAQYLWERARRLA